MSADVSAAAVELSAAVEVSAACNLSAGRMGSAAIEATAPFVCVGARIGPQNLLSAQLRKCLSFRRLFLSSRYSSSSVFPLTAGRGSGTDVPVRAQGLNAAWSVESVLAAAGEANASMLGALAPRETGGDIV